MKKTVLITGGTGFIGQYISKEFIEHGYDVIILTRNKKNYTDNSLIQYAEWDIEKGFIEEWVIPKSDIIICLAGENVMSKRWTKKQRKKIVESRTKTNLFLIEQLKKIPNKISLIIGISAIGFYGEDTSHSLLNGFNETDKNTNQFLSQVCVSWEKSYLGFQKLQKQLVVLRLGVVLYPEGSALKNFIKLVEYKIGFILGNGKQIISWIHIKDLKNLFLFIMEKNQLQGIYNAVAPNPVPNEYLMGTIIKSMQKRLVILLRIPSFVIKILLGKRSLEILKSTNVSCQKILQQGFIFQYNKIEDIFK